ncbi:NUDIX domain-containing protein [Sporosarcina oncorhynchi]|uniref:NUDIX domain-containing protein n=1 Tax=Sporosarcina oncorhynchi TaxID=3056444 RepID=A0ABZ0L445_9BACL|nr:NUDIX domain-containing protein [Sporosarcina sp. T2O-4]WOV86683.1 NUDIX domain-containing protein [Sporosarcina sp. T2O-4]
MEVKRKVLAYITTGRDSELKLLIFEHKNKPDAGWQVPGGSIEKDELLIDALYREIEEETGILREQLELNGKVNKRNYFPANRKHIVHERNIFHLTYTGPEKSEWDFIVRGDGADSGMVFHCLWIPVQELPSLAAEQDTEIEFII